MSSKCSVVLLLGLVIVVTGSLEVPKIKHLKQQTQLLSEQNPKNGPACFSVYRPKLDSISTQYEVEYTSCNSEFAEQNALEDLKWQTRYSQLDENAVSACRALTDCSAIVGYVEAFECYAQMGAEQSRAMYTLSANALQLATEMREYYQLIETTKTICINNAERTYVESATKDYEQLHTCLMGNVSPHSTTPNYTPRYTTYPTTTTKRAPTTTPRTTTPRPTYNTGDWFTSTTAIYGPPPPPRM
ncbi:uncharacterized protein LOC117791077 isoform X2 [Drosophila innubila]|uniref:uncharacterized protein LOC117791077 isoform X2 n=1 Tax=Drosophila innubila TaxID=198719 RepID=UPI00148DA177|nr:uncharacterized protein LOC117791077 isoform X2 [Drosophila innubila]